MCRVLDEFSEQLQTHLEILQNMAIIKSFKTGRDERKGKSTKTIKEQWDKKDNVGKYQVSNTKEFSTNGLEKKGRKVKIYANLSDKALIDNTRLPIVFVP